MQVFPHRSRLIRRQHNWWHTLKVIFSAQYSLQTIIVAAILIALGSLAYIWQWTNYLQLGYQTQALNQEKSILQERIALLEIEVSFLTRLERLDRIATTQMKMRPPSPAQRLVLPPDNSHENE